MMHSTLGLPPADMSHIGYPSTALMMDASSQAIAYNESLPRLHRASNPQRPSGAMRVVKPSSTSNSPQARAARRRTMMADSNIARRRGQHIDQATLHRHFQYSPPSTASYGGPTKQSTRPLSWHPSSNLQARQQQEQCIAAVKLQQEQQHLCRQGLPYQMLQPHLAPQYVMPTTPFYGEDDGYTRYQNLPPTPAVMSAQSSPLLSMYPSTVSNPNTGSTSRVESPPHYFAPAAWNQSQQLFCPNNAGYAGSPDVQEAFPSLPTGPMASWESLQQQEYHHGGITPPTPQDNPSTQRPDAITVSPEESIPYEPLEGSDEEGEILVGMGLYDDPEKGDNDDPWLDNYRRTTSELLGTTYRRVGQGLKLEESWEPPASDDENDSEDSNSERDADGEEQDDEDGSDDAQTWI